MTSINRRTALVQMGAVATAALIAETLRAEGFPNGQAAPAPATPLAPPSGPFTLPDLPYEYDALEPSFDAATMHLHHDKHHQAYVNNLNIAVAAHPELNGRTVEELIANLNSWPESARTAVRNQGGGQANHSFWWPTLGKGGAALTGELAKAIDAKFGSFSAFQDKLTAASMSVFGSGWA
jgi:Fe-Mn family superoxide dismutase